MRIRCRSYLWMRPSSWTNSIVPIKLTLRQRKLLDWIRTSRHRVPTTSSASTWNPLSTNRQTISPSQTRNLWFRYLRRACNKTVSRTTRQTGARFRRSAATSTSQCSYPIRIKITSKWKRRGMSNHRMILRWIIAMSIMSIHWNSLSNRT